MRGQSEPEKIDEFVPYPASALIQWLLEVEYDCDIGISREVHDMEIHYWESFTLTELPQQISLQSPTGHGTPG
jgi:hypothetical protein